MNASPADTALQAGDGHRWTPVMRIPARPRAALLWLPALGVAARHYAPLAEALSAQGIAVLVHEWRGNGSSSLRAGRDCDWGYRELLTLDLPASEAALASALPDVPRILGGHSLGGQLACCLCALAPQRAQRLWLVASGSPYWRAFPMPHRLWLPLAYRFLPWLARRRGALRGRAVGFGGKEARGLIADWARSALSGRYAAAGLPDDLEAGLRRIGAAVTALVLEDDWLAPASSLRFLLSKLGADRTADIETLDAGALGTTADHFAWMQQPQTVAERLARDLQATA